VNGIDENDVAINLGEGATPNEREAVEASIRALSERAERLSMARRLADAAAAAVSPPPPELDSYQAAGDEGAIADVLETVAGEQRTFLDEMAIGEVTTPATEQLVALAAPPVGGVASDVFGIPFHYDWAWRHGLLVFENRADRSTGRIRVDVSGRRRGDAHAGFGVSVRADRDHWATARSLRRSAERCRVRSGATGAVALAEGGTEMTVMEAGTLLAAQQDKRFRIRLNPGFWSGPEEQAYDSGGVGTGGPIDVTWFMRRGHTYQINVGAWVLAEWTSGPHASGDISWCSGAISADALAITLFHG
jgi:hypothetical protein